MMLSFLFFHLDDFYSPESAKSGWVGVYSLKNPAYPEYVCKAHCGVMAVDVHPKHPHMLAVALSDGNVAVYNLQKSTEKPAYISTARNGKHQDIAWQVFPFYYLPFNKIWLNLRSVQY